MSVIRKGVENLIWHDKNRWPKVLGGLHYGYSGARGERAEEDSMAGNAEERDGGCNNEVADIELEHGLSRERMGNSWLNGCQEA